MRGRLRHLKYQKSEDGVPATDSLSVAFRRATGKDLKPVMKIFKKCFDDQMPEEYCGYKDFFKKAAGDLRFHFIVATWGAEIVGFALVNNKLSPASLDIIGVDPSYQSIGIGSKLMEEAEQAAARLHSPKIQLNVRADNATAISLYEARCYHQVRTLDKYYPHGDVDALVMEKPLTALIQDNARQRVRSLRR
jgi:ribosomal protein S18 acetylase RimI-like enzyme